MAHAARRQKVVLAAVSMTFRGCPGVVVKFKFCVAVEFANLGQCTKA
jgi:hypothetical protein